MATMTSCILNGKKISVDEAIIMRDAHRTSPEFVCNECGKRVRPHRQGGHAPAHFEHLRRNSDCSQSHVAR